MKKRGLILVVIILLIISIGAFSFLNGLKFRENDVMYINDSLNFSSLSLKQKIAQMIIVSAKDKSDVRAYTQLNIGGIFIDDLNSKKEYNLVISLEEVDNFENRKCSCGYIDIWCGNYCGYHNIHRYL